MFTELITDPYLIIVCVIASAFCFFHYADAYLESDKEGKIILTPPLTLKKDLKSDFSAIENKARLSISVQEKEEVQKMIDIFKEQYSHYSETRYNVQILQCINRMRNKTVFTYKFEFLN